MVFLVSIHVVCGRLFAMASRMFGSFCLSRIFGSIFQEYHTLGKALPLLRSSRSELGTLSFEYPRIHSPLSPPLQKWKFGQNLALWVLGTQEYTTHLSDSSPLVPLKFKFDVGSYCYPRCCTYVRKIPWILQHELLFISYYCAHFLYLSRCGSGTPPWP